MATVRKRGTTRPFSWDAPVRMRGWPAQTKTFPTKADAEQWGSEREAERRIRLMQARVEPEAGRRKTSQERAERLVRTCHKPLALVTIQ